MVYVGIDIGKRKHEATFLDAAGQQLGKSLTFDDSPQGFQSLSRRVASLAAEEVIYGLEATGHYWLPLYTALVEAGCTVKVINPIQSDSLRNLYKLILTIPVIGPTNGAAILGEIGDINRFDGPKKLRAYAGLDASVYQSGGFEGSHPRMSKRGSPYLRRALWTAAVVASQRDTRFKEFYERLLARGKHPKQALVAVAAKLCGIIYAVLSKNEPYDPNHLTNTHN